MKKLIIAAVIVGATAVAALAGRTAVVGKQENPNRAELVRVARRDIGSTVKATGVVRPAVGAEVRVGAQASGTLRRLHVQIGDVVRPGQLLAELEARELAARRDQAAAVLLSNRASLSFDAADLARKQTLAAEHAVAASELDLAVRSLAIAQAAVAEAQANLAFAQAQLDETSISAPTKGAVAAIATHEGEAVSAGIGATTILTLIDLERLEALAYVDETDIGRVQIGQRAHFTVDAYPEQDFAGQVVAIYPKPEIRDNVVNYIVVVRFVPSPGPTLRPEMTANVKILLDTRENVLAVPRRAVHREQGRAFVLCRKDGQVERRYVTTGSHDDTSWEITDGLLEGEQVLLGDSSISATVTK